MRGEHAAREQRRVVHGIHAAGSSLEHGLDQPVSTREHDVGTEAAHELLVLGFRVSEHAEPAMLCDPDHVRRQQPGAAGHGERLPLRQPERLETADRGQCVHRQRRGLLEGRTLGDRHDGSRGRDEQLRLRAALGAPRQTIAITSSPTASAVHLRPDGLDDAGAVPPGHPGGGTPSTPRSRGTLSDGCTGAAFTASLTSPAPGSGISRSMTVTTSGPPGRVIPTARAVVTATRAARRCCSTA